MDRIIMHVDMDAFFASVEQLDHEEYRGKPLIVGGLGGRGVVSTCSYEARKFGVHSAMPTAKAMKLCPQGIFIRGNYPRYSEVSRQIFDIFEHYSPLIEPLSIDEAFLDISGMEHLMDNPFQYAKKLKQEVKEKTGIVASVGIAPNKFLAKIASDLDKPDGLVVVDKGKVQEFLDPLPVRRIWGVGAKTAMVLERLQIRTIADLRKMTYDVLHKTFGAKTASHLFMLAQGKDERPVAPRGRAKSIGNEVTFGEDLQNAEDALQVLLELSVKVGWRLRKAGFKAKTIQLKLRTRDFTTYTRQKQLFEPSNYDNDIYTAIQDLFTVLNITHSIRLLGVSASGFDEMESLSLFHDKKKDKLYQTIDDINSKFGKLGVTRGRLIKK
ncbi:DNA polymerase IV [Anaerovibrio lipolyticus]|uniref:DNA polymerase IV n=1 Tax=Anaerovibrio lipolyticus TaxID=82374 RepID=UPI0026EBB24E|nr:DNA polymerase IV [Anaerovibrio lipolyticus]MBE6104763.1 DNA polymerase IV [Anaerovibrio lipolyticus]